MFNFYFSLILLIISVAIDCIVDILCVTY